MSYTPRQFNVPEINGISPKTIEEHLKLYAGYVKNVNLILEKIPEYRGYEKEDAFAPYVVSELHRRFAFEFNGMRNHEYYFEQLEGGQKSMNAESGLMKKVVEDFGSYESWMTNFTSLCLTRGIGWAILWYDSVNNKLMNSWVDEQHLGHLNGLTFIYGIDMWEHSYLFDYTPGDKKKYVEAYLNATNHEVSEKRFEKAQRQS